MTIRQMWGFKEYLTFSHGKITGGFAKQSNYFIWGEKFENLKPNTTYTISLDYKIKRFAGDEGKRVIIVSKMTFDDFGRCTRSFTTDENGSCGSYSVEGIGCLINGRVVEYIELSNFQLEEGSTATPYVPYGYLPMNKMSQIYPKFA